MSLRCSGGRSDFRMVALAITWENGNVMLSVHIKKFVLTFVKNVREESKYKIKSIVLVKKYG